LYLLCWRYPPFKILLLSKKKLESPFFLLLSNFLYRYTPKGVSFWILRKTLKIVFIALIGKNTAFFPWNPNPPTFLSWNPICRSLVLLNGMPSVILKKKMKAQILHVPNFQLIDTLPKASKKTFLRISLFVLFEK